MDLKSYLRTLDPTEKRALAATIGTKVIYLIQIAGRHASPSAKMALAIERAVGGKVTRHELRPDLYPIDSGPHTTAVEVPTPGDGYRQVGVPAEAPPPCDEAGREGVA